MHNCTTPRAHHMGMAWDLTVNAPFTPLGMCNISPDMLQCDRTAGFTHASEQAANMLTELQHSKTSLHILEPSGHTAHITRKPCSVPSSHVTWPDGPMRPALAYYPHPPSESSLCKETPCRQSSPMWNEAHCFHPASYAPKNLSLSRRHGANPSARRVRQDHSSERSGCWLQSQASKPSCHCPSTKPSPPRGSLGRCTPQSSYVPRLHCKVMASVHSTGTQRAIKPRLCARWSHAFWCGLPSSPSILKQSLQR